MGIHEESKDPKKSIRLKYNRRKEYLRHCLQQFLIFAEERLDESKYGKIYKKNDVTLLYEGAKELLAKFPPEKEIKWTEEHSKSFELMMDLAGEDTEKILSGLDLSDDKYNDFLKQLEEAKSKLNDEEE